MEQNTRIIDGFLPYNDSKTVKVISATAIVALYESSLMLAFSNITAILSTQKIDNHVFICTQLHICFMITFIRKSLVI